MKGKYLLVVLFVCVVGRVVSQSFVIHDTLVSSPDAQIGDIEIDPYHKRICWQSITDDKLWVCNLDTVTWGLTVPDGKESLIDSLLVPLKNSHNGGEWGFDQSHTFLVYNKEINRKRFVAVANETGQTWTLLTLTDSPHRMNPHASRNPSDSVAAIFYIRSPFSVNTKFKFLDHPDVEHSVTCFKDTHWFDEDQLLTGILINHQVGIFDPVHPATPVQLTNDTAVHFSQPYMWRAPEHGNARMFFARAGYDTINVYKEIVPSSNNFGLYLTFKSPSPDANYQTFASPEPVVYQGQSYISFMVSSSPAETSYQPAQIWVVKVDSLQPVFRMVSDTAIGIRTDPETLGTNEKLLVFYTEVIGPYSNEPVFRLHQCETGFGQGMITGVDEQPDLVKNHFQVYPNPFTSHINPKNLGSDEQFMLADLTGKTIWAGSHIENTDFSELSAGVYFLKIISRKYSETMQLIKL